MSIDPTKLKPRPHQLYYNGFFLLRMPLIINGQPAEISYNDKGKLTLNCRYPSLSITFDSLFNDVNTVVEKYGLSGITNYWCEDAPLFQLKFSTPDGMKTFINTAEVMRNELASIISAQLAEQQRVFHPDTSQANLPVIVHTEVFLVTPDPINKDADLRTLTAESLSACLSLWRESKVFDFKALFRAYGTRQEKDCGPPTLHQLLVNLSDAVEWYLLGIYLDIPESDLEKIRYENHWNVTDCKREMLSTWLRRNPQPSWATVVTTLNDIGRRSMAHKIALKYGIPTPSCSLKAKRIPTLKSNDPVQQKIYKQVEEIRSRIVSKDTELMVKKQTSSEAQNARTLSRKNYERVRQDAVQVQTRVTQLITQENGILKLLEQKQCRLRTLQRAQEREKGELQSLIDEKSDEIPRLKQELEAVQAELVSEKKKSSCNCLQKRLQQATEDLAGKSARVQELEWVRQKLETLLDSERKRVDQLLMQQTAASNSQQQYAKEIENQLSAARRESEAKAREMEGLKQTIALKEGEVKGLHTQLQSQEALLQRLLTKPLQDTQPDPTQELEVEEELKGLTVGVAELRARLVEAEDVRQDAQRQMEVAQLESELLLELTTELKAARQPPPVKCKQAVRQPPAIRRKPAVKQVGQRRNSSHIELESSQHVYQSLLQVESSQYVYQSLLQGLPSKQEDVKEKCTGNASSPMPLAAASSTSHTGPGDGSPVEECYMDLHNPSTEAAEKKTTAVDQPGQAEGRPRVWAPGTKVVGKYDFTGSVAHDLPFKRGDTLTIIVRSKDPNWYEARRYDGQEGRIPYNYVARVEDALAPSASATASSATHTGPRQATDDPRRAVKLHAMPWFHGDIGRESADQLLKPFKNGNFLLRESSNYRGSYILCVSYGTKVKHYRVRKEHNWVTIDEEVYFENLVKLVEHYQEDADGLCCRLEHPVKTSGNIEYTVSVQDFKERGWAIPRKSLNKKNLIRNGQSKDVWLREYQGQKVVIVMAKDLRHSQQLLAEAAVMTALRHPNLVSLIGVCLDEPPLCLITEYMAKGSLLGHLRSQGRTVISQQDQLGFARDVCKGMVYLEAQNLVHRCLAATNVLIGDDNTAKVSNFSLTREEFMIEQGGKVPIRWTAPEAILYDEFSSKSDVWSFGILLWEIYSYGQTPPQLPIEAVAGHVAAGNRLSTPEGCPDGAYQIMKKCWDKHACYRPIFTQIGYMLEGLSTCTGYEK